MQSLQFSLFSFDCTAFRDLRCLSNYSTIDSLPKTLNSSFDAFDIGLNLLISRNSVIYLFVFKLFVSFVSVLNAL